MALVPAPANDAPSESTMTLATPASDSPPTEDQTQDMEVDDYATHPSLPSTVSCEDDDLLSGLPQSEATEVESGLAHLSVSSPRGPNGEGEEASHEEALPLPHHSDWEALLAGASTTIWKKKRSRPTGRGGTR